MKCSIMGYKCVDPSEMQHYAAFHLGLHYLQKYSFRGFPKTKGFYLQHSSCNQLFLIRMNKSVDHDQMLFQKLSDLDLQCFQNRIYGPRHEKTYLRGFANNTGADQPAHPRSLISAFVIRFLESIMSRLATS